MRRQVLAILLVLATMPSAAELVEWAVHLVEHGDFAHTRDGAHEHPEGEEHGCTPLFHTCGCHASAASTPVARSVPALRKDPGARTFCPPLVTQAGRTAGPPPHRPPIGLLG